MTRAKPNIVGHRLLRNRIEAILAEMDVQGGATTEPSVVLKVLGGDDPFEYQWNGDVPYYPACMIKVPLALAYFDLIARDRIDPWAEIVVPEECITETAGPAPYVAGQRYSIFHFIYYALQFSDNIAFNVLINSRDRAELTSIVRSYGLAHTAINRMLSGFTPISDPQALGRNQSNAKDIALLFELIYQERVPGADTMKAYMRKVSSQREAIFASSGEYFNKTGYTTAVMHEAYMMAMPGSKALICSVFSSMPWSDDGWAKFHELKVRLREAVLRVRL